MKNLKQKNRDIHLLVIKDNWLSGSADRERQARRGHGFYTESQKIIGNLRNPILKKTNTNFNSGISGGCGKRRKIPKRLCT